MKSIKIPAPDFNLAMTLDSGQVFHWEKVGNGFVGLIGDAPVYVQQQGNVLKVNMEGGAPATPGERRVKGVSSLEFAPSVAHMSEHYFVLDQSQAKICSRPPSLSVQVNVIWNHGRLCLIQFSEKSCVPCPAWEPR